MSQLISGALARVGRLDPADTGDPCGVSPQCLTQRLDLAHPAAFVRLAREQVLAVQLVLLGDAVLRRDVDHVDVVDRLDRVAGADRLDEVVARVQEQHVDAGTHLGRQVDQYRVLHVGSHHVASAEVLVGPAQQLVGACALQFGRSALGQLLQFCR